MNIPDQAIVAVLRLIRNGETNTAVPACGAILRAAKGRGLLVDSIKADGSPRQIPTITPRGHEMLDRYHGRWCR